MYLICIVQRFEPQSKHLSISCIIIIKHLWFPHQHCESANDVSHVCQAARQKATQSYNNWLLDNQRLSHIIAHSLTASLYTEGARLPITKHFSQSHYYLHLFLNHSGCWGTTGDFHNQFPLFFSVWDLANSRPLQACPFLDVVINPITTSQEIFQAED